MAGTYGILTLSNTSLTNTASGAITATTLTTTAGGILNMVTFDLVVTTITNNGTIRTQSLSATPLTTGKTWGGTVNYDATTGAQTVMSGTYGILTLSNTSGTDTASGDLVVTGTLTIGSGATLDAAGATLTLSGSGTPLVITGTFSADGSTVVYSSTSATNIAAATYSSLQITGAATKTLLGNTTATSTLTLSTAGSILDGGGYTLTLSGSGTPLTKSSGKGIFQNIPTITYSSASATNIATGTYTNLVLTGAITKTLLGNTTATSTVTIPASGILAIGTYTFTATDATWTNGGTVSEGTGGKIVLAAAGVLSNSAGGGAVTSFGSFDSYPVIHIQITDTSLNLVAATVETKTATVTGTSGITDSETVTLTETTVSSGIFRGSLTVNLSGSNVTGKLDYQGNGTVSYAWTDSQDADDTESGSASFTGTTPGGGSGGGGGGAATVVTATTVTTPILTVTPETTTPTTIAPAASTLESVQSKVTSVIAKIAALPANPTASDLTSIQAEIAAILADLQTLQATATPQGAALGYNFVRPLAFGMSHNDVRNLQTALKTDSSIYPGGKVTGYFGPATLLAIKKFQEKYGIASSGQPGYGNVGPATRAKLNELYGSK